MLSNTSNSCNKISSGASPPNPQENSVSEPQSSEESECGGKNGDATTRNPTLPSRKSGSFPPRYAQRAKPAGSIHEPPRNIRARSPSNSSRPSFGSYG